MHAALRREPSAACTSWARTRRCPIPTRTTRARRCEARMAGGAGDLPHRDLLPRRRHTAGDRVAGEGRHGHQHRPHGADRAQALDAPGEACPTCGSSRRSRGGWGSTGTTRAPRTCSNEMRRAMPSIAGITWERLEARELGDLSVRERGRSGPAGRVHRPLPDRDRQGRFVPADIIPPPSARRRLSRWCSSPGASSSTGIPAR
jgi:hypothetical protein